MKGLSPRHERNSTSEAPSYLVIPAAGLGTGMQAVHPSAPKEMLPVGHKPAIQYAVEEGIAAGIENIVIVISREKEIVRQYFEDKKVRENMFPEALGEMEKVDAACNLTFLYQEEPVGEADAISLARDIVRQQTTATIYPDNIYLPAAGALRELGAVHEKYGQVVAGLAEVTEENALGLGDSGKVDLIPVEAGVFRIERFYPKGVAQVAPGSEGELRACGMAVWGPHLFEFIERARNNVEKGEFTDLAVVTLILKEKGMLGCRLRDIVFDIGNPAGYKQCLAYIADPLAGVAKPGRSPSPGAEPR